VEKQRAAFLFIDTYKVEQVIRNLITNAVRSASSYFEDIYALFDSFFFIWSVLVYTVKVHSSGRESGRKVDVQLR